MQTDGWRSDSTLPRPFGSPGPGARMPLLSHGRALKRWRYVGVFGPELMLCAAQVRIGPARQSFWGIWDGESLRGRTRVLAGHRAVAASAGRLAIHDADVSVDLEFDEGPGIESVCDRVWTRKQAGIRVRGLARVGARELELGDGTRAVVDETVGYHPRHTSWWWSAGVGRSRDGAEVAWNLVSGVNDPPRGSERTIWLDGKPSEPGPVRFAPGLDGIEFSTGEQLFSSTLATRSRRENLLIVRSDYEQPFATFSGSLPGGIEIAHAYGVMERHEAHW